MITTLTKDTHMYNESTNTGFDYNTIEDITMGYNNKLLVSFTTREDIDDLISIIVSSQSISITPFTLPKDTL